MVPLLPSGLAPPADVSGDGNDDVDDEGKVDLDWMVRGPDI